jgi:hypothetical protein
MERGHQDPQYGSGQKSFLEWTANMSYITKKDMVGKAKDLNSLDQPTPT